jgi:hypothetical protein
VRIAGAIVADRLTVLLAAVQLRDGRNYAVHSSEQTVTRSRSPVAERLASATCCGLLRGRREKADAVVSAGILVDPAVVHQKTTQVDALQLLPVACIPICLYLNVDTSIRNIYRNRMKR